MRTLRSLKFLFTAPFILVLLVVINWITSPGHWWVQWAALGLGIAWVIALFRVMRALVLVGGLAALAAWLANRGKTSGTGPLA
ncbi:MAG TPA: hypothetical protein VFV19_11560 [Candidatus Polarisedimenticolaceae bacterium]|nr:hypothetical protein [Candidatus Polarisedimenticolaceae bacterium]